MKREGTGHVLESGAAVVSVSKLPNASQGTAPVVEPTAIMNNVQWKQKRRMRKLMTPEDMMSKW